MEVGDIVRIIHILDDTLIGKEGIYQGVVPTRNHQSWTDCHVQLIGTGTKITIETDCIAFVRKGTPIDKWLYG